jgi:hypothetical protein
MAIKLSFRQLTGFYVCELVHDNPALPSALVVYQPKAAGPPHFQVDKTGRLFPTDTEDFAELMYSAAHLANDIFTDMVNTPEILQDFDQYWQKLEKSNYSFNRLYPQVNQQEDTTNDEP